jgi:anti-sigma regulatory factor (Ser/Thr protein kinase)
MSRIELHRLTSWVTEAAIESPDALPDALMAHAGIGRRAALKLLDELTELGWLVAERRGRRKHFAPGALREVVRRYALDSVGGPSPWTRDFARCVDLPAPVLTLVRHVFNELLDNAADHSGGTEVVVSLRQTATQAQLLVSDNGCGLFDRIARGLSLYDPLHVLLELSKGGLSTDPRRHAGRGLFYALRAADVLDLRANASAWQHRLWERTRWRAGRALGLRGTTVYAAFALDTTRRLDDVLRSASIDGQGYALDRAALPLRLLAGGTGLVSALQAQRVAARLEHLRAVTLDFDGVGAVGPEFIAELRRLLPRDPRRLEVTPIDIRPDVVPTLAVYGPSACHAPSVRCGAVQAMR